MNWRLCNLLVFLLGLSLNVGCSGGGKVTVDGTVTLDGQAVASGTVTFIKQDETSLAREGAVIKDGKFQAQIPPGKYKLELNGQKVISTRTQKDFDGKDETLEVKGEMFPAKYNKQSTLTEEIKAGPHPIKLDLTSDPK
jgi:hypothetical protein